MLLARSLRRLQLEEGGFDKLRQAVTTMLDTHDIDSFCTAVTEHLLDGLNGRDVICGEDSFAQGTPIIFFFFALYCFTGRLPSFRLAIYYGMVLARRPADSVQKEFKIDPIAGTCNGCRLCLQAS